MKKVAINASGGGSDSGISANGLVEKNITLEISKIIADILKKSGVEVLMLRNGDETTSYEERINKLKSTYPDQNEVLVISNTLNSGGSSGIEIIYPLKKNDTLSKVIANNLDYFNETKYYQMRWPTDTSKDYYYITRNTDGYETIIIRYGYLDNQKDANIIKNDYKKMAESVAEAILNYLGVVSNADYVVVKGDTLYSIAKKFNTTVDKLKKSNNLVNNSLSIGQILKIPNNNPTNESFYEVVKGDNLYSIAKKFNMTVDELKKLNNLTSNNISIGMLLKTSRNKTIAIKPGDTLYSLAKQNNTTVDEIKKLNNLTNNNLSVGSILYLP